MTSQPATAPGGPRDPLSRLFDVRDRVVLVTGGASGLGLAISTALAAVDVSDPAAVTALVEGIIARHGRLDAAFANAGIARGRGPNHAEGQIDEFSLADWHELLGVNLHGVLHTVRAAAAPMKRQRGDSIVVTASTAGLRQDPFVSFSYVVAKAGVVNLVRQAALDLARWQVRVNAIAPGPFRTNIGGKGTVPASAEAQWNATVPLGRMGDPTEIAGLALLLASGASSFMTGGVYLIDGGHMLQSLPLPEPSTRTPSGGNVAGESLPEQ